MKRKANGQGKMVNLEKKTLEALVSSIANEHVKYAGRVDDGAFLFEGMSHVYTLLPDGNVTRRVKEEIRKGLG